MSRQHGIEPPLDEPALPLLARVEAERSWHVRVLAADDGLAPTLPAGSLAVVDTTERRLLDGEFYAVRDGEAVALWLWHAGFAGMGGRLAGREVGSLVSLAEPARWRAPVEPRELVVLGRVTGVLGATAAAADPVLRLEQEREALSEQLTLAELDRRDLDLEWHDRADPLRGLSDLAPAEIRARLERARSDPAIAAKLDLERRIEGLQSRLSRLEASIAETPTTSLAGVRAKLQLVWALHYAPFPEDEPSLERAAIGTALRALDAVLASARSGEPAGSSERAGSKVLRLVPSPRRRP